MTHRPDSRLLAFWHALLLYLLLTTAAVAQEQRAPDYQLGAGDTVRVLVFQSPDLTVEARVSENGNISMPLIGSIGIGGMSITDAEKKIAGAFRTGGFLQQPQINIVLLQVRGSQVAVLGRVNRPGRFPLETANMRVTDVLAMAGGTTPDGNDVVVLTGIREGKPFRREIDIAAMFIGERPADNLTVMGGDTLYVHRAPQFYIYGEAQRSGPYRIERGMTVMQGLAMGGGPTPRGSETRLRLHRRDANGTVQQLTPALTDRLLPDDVIYVRESLF